MTGFICLDKPEGITSFTAVNRARHICSQKKAGHTGTLDPMATGVLPVMFGAATKFADYIPAANKKYTADILLGVTTDSYDVTGRVLSEKEVNVSLEELLGAIEQFTGELEQLPPMYSAVSQNGVRLYKLARQGIEVERKKRSITVYSSHIVKQKEKNVFTLSVECSPGTYVRSLISDIGEYLGCGACMKSLRRTSSNGFDISDAITLEELEDAVKCGELEKHIKKVDDVLEIYPCVTVTQAQAKRFSNGGALSLDRLKDLTGEGFIRVYSPENKFLGLGSTEKEKCELIIAKLLTEEK
ncbi:MAG: tRNA pseudouridine(55) synthase TruB [Clostridia bacterium]|nr:tRNA pseudouridine(55) synthase TruB [Clostridia bacterium]